MRATLLASLALCLSSCISVGADLAPSTIPLDEGKYTVVGDRAQGTAWGGTILWFAVSEPNVTALARDRAIELGGAEALVDVSLSTRIYLLPFASIYRTTVTGVPVTLHK